MYDDDAIDEQLAGRKFNNLEYEEKLELLTNIAKENLLNGPDAIFEYCGVNIKIHPSDVTDEMQEQLTVDEYATMLFDMSQGDKDAIEKFNDLFDQAVTVLVGSDLSG
jgi:hypothetical protein